MTEEQRSLLDQLFEAASAVPESDRAAWLSAHCGDPEIRAELESLLPHAGVNGGFTHAVGAAAALVEASRFDSGHMIGPYRIVGVLGEGGMGTVYEGTREDGEFRHKVALKVLRFSSRSDASRRRFLQERQILAELEHPNIARMFDGGTAEDGSPYIVMERIDGVPLIEYANKKNLSIRQRLELFRQVASGVQYAHQKLIVHRDLKPGNILVTSDGTPKLLDFGIAKLIDNDSTGEQALTATGHHLMTPDYASPEQVQGKPVTVASDVYSLGAVLYELLTGARPHGLKTYDPAEITEKVCLREVPAPSTTGVASLKGDLDTIVQKAMHKAPDRRYNSAEQFSEDIRRYLTGMPVLARPDTVGYRMRKFVRRHWIILSAAVAIEVVAGVGIATTHYQARLARDRFDLVRTLSNKFLFDFYDSVSPVAGTTKSQQLVVNTAVEYLDKLSATAGSDRGLLQEMAEAYLKLGRVQGSLVSSAGNLDSAKASYQRAVDFYRRLAALDPSKKSGLAVALYRLSSAENRQSQYEASLVHTREALQIMQDLVAADPRNTTILSRLSDASVNESRALSNLHRTEEAIASNQRGQGYIQKVLELEPTTKHKFQLAILQEDEGSMRVDSGDVEGAVAIFARMRHDVESLVAAEPANPNYLRSLHVTLGDLAAGYFTLDALNLHDPERALQAQEASLTTAQKLADLDPADRATQIDLAISESETATPLTAIDARKGVAMAQKAVARFDGLLKTKPDDSFILPRRARAVMRLAMAYLAAGQTEEAVQRANEAASTLRDLAAKNPQEDFLNRSAVLAFAINGEALAAGHREADAKKAFNEAVSAADRLLSSKNAALSDTLSAAFAFDRIGNYWKSRGDRAQARQWYERSAKIWEARPEKTKAVEAQHRQAEQRVHEL